MPQYESSSITKLNEVHAPLAILFELPSLFIHLCTLCYYRKKVAIWREHNYEAFHTHCRGRGKNC